MRKGLDMREVFGGGMDGESEGWIAVFSDWAFIFAWLWCFFVGDIICCIASHA